MFRSVIHACLLVLIFASAFVGTSVAQSKNTSETNKLSIQILTNKSEIILGEESRSDEGLLIGLEMEAESGWHFYWAGLGTELLEPTITWDLPEGMRVEALNHPEPSRFDYGAYMGYGYDGSEVFLYRLVSDEEEVRDYNLGDLLTISATVDWILCKDVCIFGTEMVSLDWTISDVEEITPESIFLNGLLEAEEAKTNQGLENRFLEMGVLGWLMAAFLGGVILNLMPCVLPVLSIKVFSLIQHADGAASTRYLHGTMYTLGAVLSFIVLALVLIGLRSIGEEVGWGFQLQDPYFIAFLIILFFLLGLNMLGVYELGSSWSRLSNASISNRSDWLGSFGTGILAAVVGAPCVGPFIGGVSGIALQVNSTLGVLIFACIGLGMAFPFLLLSWFPGLLRFLPKPGAWMVTFRQAMGVLLILSTAFLVWVVGQSAGTNGVMQILLVLFFVLIASWVLGRWGRISESKETQRLAKFLSLCLIVIPGLIVSQNLAELYEAEGGQASIYEEGPWKEWSEESVADALNFGHGVFIDFTASWCLICQSNKVLVLRKEKTESLFEDYGIRLFVADWTQNDPEITRALERYGRSGVPLYVLKAADGTEQILPQNLSYSAIESAVKALFSEQ
jgi:thiol:disulfide interchange protein